MPINLEVKPQSSGYLRLPPTRKKGTEHNYKNVCSFTL